MSMNQQQGQDGTQRQQMDGGLEQQQRSTATQAPDNQGEGNREAARRYNESQQKFVQDERVDEAAERAAPQSREDASEMESAERQGRAHAKGEDPQARGGERRQQEQDRDRMSSNDKPSAAEGARSSDF